MDPGLRQDDGVLFIRRSGRAAAQVIQNPF
jgi:hypothetical protein